MQIAQKNRDERRFQAYFDKTGCPRNSSCTGGAGTTIFRFSLVRSQIFVGLDRALRLHIARVQLLSLVLLSVLSASWMSTTSTQIQIEQQKNLGRVASAKSQYLQAFLAQVALDVDHMAMVSQSVVRSASCSRPCRLTLWKRSAQWSDDAQPSFCGVSPSIQAKPSNVNNVSVWFMVGVRSLSDSECARAAVICSFAVCCSSVYAATKPWIDQVPSALFFFVI